MYRDIQSRSRKIDVKFHYVNTHCINDKIRFLQQYKDKIKLRNKIKTINQRENDSFITTAILNWNKYIKVTLILNVYTLYLYFYFYLISYQSGEMKYFQLFYLGTSISYHRVRLIQKISNTKRWFTW